MFDLTQLGVVHTIISLIAVAAGVVAFVRYGSISMRTGTGRTYVVMTVLTCLNAAPAGRSAGRRAGGSVGAGSRRRGVCGVRDRRRVSAGAPARRSGAGALSR